MSRPDDLQAAISAKITEIYTNYPELFPFLDEDFSSASGYGNPKVDQKKFKNYLDDLKKLAENYSKMRRKVRNK